LAQTTNLSSLKLKDSVQVFRQDTLINVHRKNENRTYDVDTVIYSSASDSLLFFLTQKKMDLYGNSQISYKGTELKSANISIDFNNDNVYARGVLSDSVPKKLIHTPVLIENGEKYYGKRMTYNFKTTRGFISSLNTKMEGAFYTGKKVKKINRNTYFIKNGTYTTCNAKPPHYYFYSYEMKVIQKKEIIAKWIWLFFGGVPFPIPVPFAVFPLQSGRRSGIIPPVFGDDPNYGYYFSRFGYFWAISNYLDLRLTADYYTRGRWGLNGRFRYAKRYNFNGEFDAGYKLLKMGEPTDPNYSISKEWNISWRHHQSLTPSMRFDANLQFVSGKNYIRNNTYNLNEALTSNIISNVNFFKSWAESGNSFSISYSRNQDLRSGDISEVLPNITFSKSQSYPFRGNNSFGKRKWYELIGYNYTGQFQNNRIKRGGQLSIRGGVLHNLNINASPKIGYFNISPSIRYQEKWYNKQIVESIVPSYKGKDSLIIKDKHKINMVRTFSLGVSASTKFYGMFRPDAFGIAAIRHTVIPSISYNYQPDFSKPLWGYYGTYKDLNGKVVKYDKFQREIFGGAPAGQQQNISLSVGNIFEMKTKVDPTDTTSEQKKIQLLNLNFSLGYNFAADSLRFSNLNLSYRTQIGEYLNFSGSSSFTPYDYSVSRSRINKFLISEGKGFLRLQNFNFSISTGLSGEKLRSLSKQEKQNTAQKENYFNQGNKGIYQGIYNKKKANFSIPWSARLSYNYSLSKPTPLSVVTYSNLSGSLDFNLTPKWKISVTGSYDFDHKEFAAPQIRITRDLHAWIMNFTWNPIGIYSGYFLEIRVKAPQLQDLKITKRAQFFNGK